MVNNGLSLGPNGFGTGLMSKMSLVLISVQDTKKVDNFSNYFCCKNCILVLREQNGINEQDSR